VAKGQKRPAQLCREHNLSESVLLSWRKEYEMRGEAAFTEKQPSSREEALEASIAELERFCVKLALENEIPLGDHGVPPFERYFPSPFFTKRRTPPLPSASCAVATDPNLIEELELDRPNLVWLSDITYVRLPQSFCYLASIIDDFSRYCVGWALSKWIDTRLTLSAFRMALEAGSPVAGLIHHSDQGVQYASSEYVERLQQAGARISMAAVGNPYENAKAESFFRTLKMEEVYLKDYQNFEEAEENIAQFIEEVYNRKRLHSSLGYLPPVEFEAIHALQARS
jgi:hypothetical protein